MPGNRINDPFSKIDWKRPSVGCLIPSYCHHLDPIPKAVPCCWDVVTLDQRKIVVFPGGGRDVPLEVAR